MHFRKRLYSWTRPSKHLSRQVKYDSEMKISGAATLAFSPDLKWFQGNIVNSDNSEVYTITGKLILNSIEENDEYPGDSHNNNDGECSIDGLDIGCSRSNKLSPISEVCRLMLSWVTSIILTSG